MLRTHLPALITLPCGAALNKRISYTPGIGQSKFEILGRIKELRGKYRIVDVLGRNLRGKLDLHDRPYQPDTWILTNVDIEQRTQPHE
jgi:hypothetical protein